MLGEASPLTKHKDIHVLLVVNSESESDLLISFSDKNKYHKRKNIERVHNIEEDTYLRMGTSIEE